MLADTQLETNMIALKWCDLVCVLFVKFYFLEFLKILVSFSILKKRLMERALEQIMWRIRLRLMGTTRLQTFMTKNTNLI